MLVRILVVAAIVIFLVAPAITTSAVAIHAICRRLEAVPGRPCMDAIDRFLTARRQRDARERFQVSQGGEGLELERAGARATVARRTYGCTRRPVFTRRLESPG